MGLNTCDGQKPPDNSTDIVHLALSGLANSFKVDQLKGNINGGKSTVAFINSIAAAEVLIRSALGSENPLVIEAEIKKTSVQFLLLSAAILPIVIDAVTDDQALLRTQRAALVEGDIDGLLTVLTKPPKAAFR